MLPVQVVADGKDISGLVEEITFSNVDPGGFEMASLQPRAGLALRPGGTLYVRHGLSVLFHGRILDPGEFDKHGISARQVGAVGFGHKLDDSPYSMIYVDRDLSRWGPTSQHYQTTLSGYANINESPSVAPDPINGSPCLVQTMVGGWPANNRFLSWYDAGQGNGIGAIWYSVTPNSNVNPGDGNWNWFAALSSDDVESARDITVNLRAASASGYLSNTGSRRFAEVQFFYSIAAGAEGLNHTLFWQLAVYGNHGLTRRGPDPGGFYPSDIALDALVRSGAGFLPQIQAADSYIVSHYLQRTPAAPSQIIGDMAKLMAWHWGVWEPGGLDDRPVFIFAPPPSDATRAIDRYACDEFDAPRVDYDKLYNVCQVQYTDAAGTTGVVEVGLPDGRLDASGVQRRVLSVNMGLGGQAAAQAYGIFALRLAQRAARTGGTVTLKGDVRLPGGGTMPAALLRAGRDRVRLLGLNDGGDLFASDTRSIDTFLVRRVECTATKDGMLSTRVDFDEGVDLMEVLTARLTQAEVVSGASSG